jgi:hypothetical protein
MNDEMKATIEATFDECILYRGSENYVWISDRNDFIEELAKRLTVKK